MDVELALYEALIATHPEVERKGKSSPYTSVNGNMFTILSADGVLGMRLGAADREAFVETFGTSLYEAHGAVMKGVRRGAHGTPGRDRKASSLSGQELRLRERSQAQTHDTQAPSRLVVACSALGRFTAQSGWPMSFGSLGGPYRND
jgi:hypothetical protein